MVVVILTLSGLAFFTYLEKPPPQSQSPEGSSPETQDAEALMQQVFETIDELKRIVEKDPKNLQALIALGNIYYDGQKFEEALVYYKKALEIDPKISSVWTDMGTMYHQLGKVDSSIICFQKGVDFDSKNKAAWFNLGLVYAYDKKEEKKALWAWKRFLELSPDDPHVQMIRDEIEKLEKKLK